MGSRLLGAGIVSAMPRRMSGPRPKRPGHDASLGAALPRAEREKCSRATNASMLCTSMLCTLMLCTLMLCASVLSISA